MLKILCTGDIHIGRRPTRLPEYVKGRLVSTAAVWDEIVHYAVDHEVDALVLTGDIVDLDNRYFEAYGPLERGFKHLAEAGIETVAVSGNHDFDVLPRLADNLGDMGFHLIGRHGRWERFILYRGGSAVLQVDGWSFPREHVYQNPLSQYDLPPGGDLPCIGLLHADLDNPGSPYAPVKMEELRQIPLSIWLLGHIHKAKSWLDDAGAAICYPGSPQALDPGEMGAHGAWLVELSRSTGPKINFIPLARVRYEHLTVDLSDVEDRACFESKVTETLRASLEEAVIGAGPLWHLRYRLTLKGRTKLHGQLETLAAELPESLSLTLGQVDATVEKVTIHTRPIVNLEALARGSDPVGLLANFLLALDEDGGYGVYGDFMGEVQDKLGDLYRASAYRQLRSAQTNSQAPGAERVVEILKREGVKLLDQLLNQKVSRE